MRIKIREIVGFGSLPKVPMSVDIQPLWKVESRLAAPLNPVNRVGWRTSPLGARPWPSV
jgi:hypothetical protein